MDDRHKEMLVRLEKTRKQVARIRSRKEPVEAVMINLEVLEYLLTVSSTPQQCHPAACRDEMVWRELIAELKKDEARLNWVQEKGMDIYVLISPTVRDKSWTFSIEGQDKEYSKVREALDAAREEKKE